MDQASVALRSVVKTFVNPNDGSDVEVIRQVDEDVQRAEFVCLLGPSGCGKSTLLEIIGGLQSATRGEIYILGKKVTSPHPDAAMVFQEDSLFPWRSVLGNLEFGMEARGIPRKERREKAREIIELIGLNGFEHFYPREISGGMRQRVAIGRALAVDPEVLLMDEPFGALDQQTRYYLGAELLRIWERSKKTILFVTHDINESILLGDRVWVMSHRPAVIKLNQVIDLPRPRDISVMTHLRFHELSNTLWEALSEEAQKAFLTGVRPQVVS